VPQIPATPRFAVRTQTRLEILSRSGGAHIGTSGALDRPNVLATRTCSALSGLSYYRSRIVESGATQEIDRQKRRKGRERRLRLGEIR
jgi:hypothetical protein